VSGPGTMKMTVLLRPISGSSGSPEVDVNVPEDATVGILLERLCEQHPDLERPGAMFPRPYLLPVIHLHLMTAPPGHFWRASPNIFSTAALLSGRASFGYRLADWAGTW